MATAIIESWAEAINQSTDLVGLEKIVEKGKSSFLEVGLALTRIHEAKLYKLTHSSWEKYCEQRWGWGRARGYQLMQAAKVSTMVDTPPENERQARALVHPVREIDTTDEEEMAALDETPTKAKAPSLQTRRTPRWLFDLLNAKFGPFALDAFADHQNFLCTPYWTKEDDGCSRPWRNATFGNPEFEAMEPALEQAVRQAALGVRSVILGPVGCSQGWYHRLAIQGTVYVPDKRISFDMPDGTPTSQADRDTIVMVFGDKYANQKHSLGIFNVRRLELGNVERP